jgi:hypothetical protein
MNNADIERQTPFPLSLFLVLGRAYRYARAAPRPWDFAYFG